MKRILVILAILVVVGILALGIFIATFDANRYRPAVLRELQKATGKPVHLDRLKLAWRGGIALQLEGLRIDESAAAPEPLIAIERASAVVRLWPLLRRDVQITSVILERPHILIARDAQGRVNLLGLAAAGAPAAASGQEVELGAQPVTINIASLQIKDGTVHWTDAMSTPAMDLRFTAVNLTAKNIMPGQPMDIELTGALVSDTPNLRVAGRLTPPGPENAGSIERLAFDVNQLPLQDVLPPSRPEDPKLRGMVTMTLEGEAASLAPEKVLQSISGTGTVKLERGVLANINILRMVFERLSIIPGLVQTFEARLPEDYRAKLTATDTVLEPITLPVSFAPGLLQFDRFTIRSDTFGLSGAGRVGMDGTVALNTQLRIDPTLSKALIASVNELQALADAQGAIELPVAIQGKPYGLAVLPDLNYVASKVVTTKVEDLIGNFLNKAFEREEPSAEPVPAPAQ